MQSAKNFLSQRNITGKLFHEGPKIGIHSKLYTVLFLKHYFIFFEDTDPMKTNIDNFFPYHDWWETYSDPVMWHPLMVHSCSKVMGFFFAMSKSGS